jgi:pSer/pThr/pTyr-binding forkhead associated (FHA) protein
MHPTIEIQYPGGRTETLELIRERTLVGRGKSADIRINDNRVSREHCAFEVSGDQVYVVDLGGSNGTWIGGTKILSNVREPLPVDATVHVGPARIKLVTYEEAFDPERDLESQAFAPVAPQRPSAPAARSVRAVGAAGAAGAARQSMGDQSVASIELDERSVGLDAGERSAIQITITNQGKIVDHYTLSVAGVPSSWVTLPKGGLELLPRQSGTLTVGLHPPRHARTSAGAHPVSIALLNRQGQIVSEVTAEIVISAFENLIVEVRPNPYQSRMGGELTVNVENHGNEETQYRVDVIEPSDSIDVVVEPATSTVAPQQSRQSVIHLRPRKRNWIGDAKRMNLAITVTGSQQSTATSSAYSQNSTIPRWLPILLLMLCCIGFILFALVGYPELKPVLFPTATAVPTPTPENTPTATPDFGATETATRAIWLNLDDDSDGLNNGLELELGTSPLSKDTDNDGLSDFDEHTRYNTDPLNHDTDGDTLEDGAEVTDGCKSPINNDTDLDGIPDNLDPDSCAGVTPTASPVTGFALGGQVNNSLDNLPIMQEAGMSWVKVQHRFSLDADPTSTMQDAAKFKEQGFKVLLSVVGNKEELERGGANYISAFAKFLGDIAPVADGIEVWNEPNIQNEWPIGQISGLAYADMLRQAYGSIKAANPLTIVISAAPAPTGTNNETVMSDDRFIGEMVRANAANFMDCIGIHFNVGATPPADTTGHPFDSNGHYSWYFLPMMDLYYDTFNQSATGGIPLCFTEIGFVTDDGFDLTLAQAGASNFLFAEANSIFDQGVWLADALERSCRSGKVLLFIVWNVDFTNYGQDPQAGYAILRPDGKCPSCERLNQAVSTLIGEGCMARPSR